MMIETLIKKNEKVHRAFCEQASAGISYYRNEAGILRTGAAAIDEVNAYLKKLGKNPLKSADNRISTNWHKIITDQKIGYLFTYPPQFDVNEGNQGRDVVKDIIKTLGDEYGRIIKQLGLDACNTGVGWLTYWYNHGEPFEYYFIDPMQVQAVYDDSSVKPVLKYIIRTYVTVDENEKEVTQYELWTDKNITYYTRSDKGEFTQGETKPHTYGEIPFICFENNADMTSDLKMYKHLIDAIDKLVSGFANDIDDIQEIIWVIREYSGETSQIDYDKDGNEVVREIDRLQKLKAEKFVTVEENGGVDILRGEIPYEARSKFLEILREQIFISAMAVNPSPEKIGQASGVYIDFLYSLLELKAGIMETEFRPALDQLVRAILKYLGVKTEMEIEQKWIRNKPRNAAEIAGIISSTPSDVVSLRTKTKEHPLVENWKMEREQIEEEEENAAENMIEQAEGLKQRELLGKASKGSKQTHGSGLERVHVRDD